MRDESLLQSPVQKLLQKLREAAQAEGIEFLVTDTLRSKAEQDGLYAQGRTKPGNIVTNTPYPQSFHNHGVAFDVVPLSNGKANYGDSNAYKKLGELGKKVGLEWGGDWASFPDKPHFQLTEGKTWKDFANGYKLKTMDNPELQAAEVNLKEKMDRAWQALAEANEARKNLATLKGVPVKKYIIIDEN